MNQNVQTHTDAWVTFTYASFAGSAFLVALGIFFLPIDLWMKGYLTMGIVMLVQTCVTLTKTLPRPACGERNIATRSTAIFARASPTLREATDVLQIGRIDLAGARRHLLREVPSGSQRTPSCCRTIR